MTIEIPLTQGQVALIDDADLPLVSQYKWHALKGIGTYYAVCKVYSDGKEAAVLMHRLILGIPLKQMVDHADGDGLNNVRSNLRPCTNSENMRNARKHRGCTSQYKGVSWNTHHRKWKAQIGTPSVFIGYFTDEEEAAKAYDAAAKKHYGAFARPNFSYTEGHP